MEAFVRRVLKKHYRMNRETFCHGTGNIVIVYDARSGHALSWGSRKEMGKLERWKMLRLLAARLYKQMWHAVKCPRCGVFHEQPNALRSVDRCLRKPR
jgi:hypothetical protein